MLGSLNLPQLSFFLILIVAFGLLLTERLRTDLVAVLIILALSGSKILSPQESLSGFGSEPAIIVVSIFVLSAALHHTGLSDAIGAWIGRAAGKGYTRAVAVLMSTVALFSAFTHHVTTTAVMLPVTLNFARERHLPASKLLMPLSFAASLGTTITIIGAPAFLIASNTLQQVGRPRLGIFSITPIGLSLSVLGTLFILLVGRFLLPERQGNAEATSRYRLDQYFTELSIVPGSPFLGKTIAEVEADPRYHFEVVGWTHRRRRFAPPFGDERLALGDVLLVRTTPEEMAAVRQDSGVELHPVAQYGAETPDATRDTKEVADLLVQAVIAPGSELEQRTISEIDFRERFGALVVGLWRREGWREEELAQTRLHAGDVLVIQGDEAALARVANDPAFLLLMPFQGEAQMRRRAPVAGGIMLVTVLAAAFNILPLEIAMLAGATAAVLSGCITAGQAYRAIDARMYVFIAGALPLGLAMQKSGAAALLAGWLQSAVGGWGETWILLAVFAIVSVITQFMSDAATVALFAPVAASLALALGHAPEPYVITVAMAAVTSFLTPLGHHGNLLIYGPGGYQFADFVRVGAPLTAVIGLAVVFLARYLWAQ